MDEPPKNAVTNVTTTATPAVNPPEGHRKSSSGSNPSAISNTTTLGLDTDPVTAAAKSSQEGVVVEADNTLAPDNPGGALKRDITTRQMLLMAAGGSIGAGLFVGSGQALRTGGPASLVLNFAICGVMVSVTMASLGEMATSYPVAGAFYDYTVRFVGRQAGFAMGWNFVFNWLIVLPFELTTIGAQLEYWNPDLEPWWFIIPFLVFLGLKIGRAHV